MQSIVSKIRALYHRRSQHTYGVACITITLALGMSTLYYAITRDTRSYLSHVCVEVSGDSLS